MNWWLQQLRTSVERFVARMAPRAMAMYTSGTPVSLVEALTPDRARIGQAVVRTFAAPNSSTHSLETVLRVARDFGTLNTSVTGAVLVSAGGMEMTPPPVDRCYPACSRATPFFMWSNDERSSSSEEPRIKMMARPSRR